MDTSRIELVIGQAALGRLQQARVALLGLGGVGSYVAEALVRSGLGALTIIDGDTVEASNINRQLPALQSTIGQRKADIVAARLGDINPQCQLTVVSKFYTPGTFEDFLDGDYDYIVDAIDDVPAKLDIIKNCVARQLPLIIACGTGNKLNPSLLKIADISQTSVCPLARRLRSALRKEGITKGVTVVFSTEEPQKLTTGATPGSLVFVPASAGMLMASYVVQNIITKDN